MLRRSAQIHLQSPEDTCRVAGIIGPKLAPGDTILLAGGVGAGKTHFARCLIRPLLHAPEDIPSPTYTLVQTYESSLGDIWHADLYRLTHLSEIDELGLADAFAGAICLVEWPNRLGDQAPEDALTITLDAPQGNDDRDITFSWVDPRWENKLRGVFE